MMKRLPTEHVDLPAAALRSMNEAARLGKLAEEEGDIKTALLSVREYSRATELMLKLRDEHAPSVDITRHPEWLELRDVVFGAIDACPDCKRRVIAALNAKRDDVAPVLVLPSGGEEGAR